MKFTTSYERLTRQTFVLDESDLSLAVKAFLKRSSQWAVVPDGYVEDIEIEFGRNDEGATYAELTRTFAKPEGSEVA